MKEPESLKNFEQENKPEPILKKRAGIQQELGFGKKIKNRNYLIKMAPVPA